MTLLTRIFLLFILTISTAITVKAQQNSARGIDLAPYNFGFSLAYNTHTLRVVPRSDFRVSDSLKTVTPISGPGFNLGMLANLKINKKVDLRFTPSLSFTDRSLDYVFLDKTKNKLKPVESTYVDLPLSLKLKSERHRNVRFYVMAGVKYSYDVISQKKLIDKDLDADLKKVKLSKNVFAYEYGFGMDFYYEYFKFSPEVKFSNSINNILTKEDALTKQEENRFSKPLDKLFSRVFQFTLYFE